MSYDREQYLADIQAKRWCQFVPKHERPVLTALIKQALNHAPGNTASVHDSESWTVKRSNDLNLVRSQLGHAEADTIRFHDSDGKQLGEFYLIYNNGSEEDPMIVIADYSANAWSDRLYFQLMDTYGE